MKTAAWNREYRRTFEKEVAGLARDRHGRISTIDVSALQSRLRDAKQQGIISLSDFFNCSCVIGFAANGCSRLPAHAYAAV